MSESQYLAALFGGRGKIGVVGMGQMGPGIESYFMAQNAAAEYVGIDIDPDVIERQRGVLEQAFQKGGREPDEFARAVKLGGDYSLLEGCHLVIEAVPEIPKLKIGTVLPGIEAVVSPNALIVSNTSGILRSTLAAAIKHPERFFHHHHFNPAAMNLVVETLDGDTGDPELGRQVRNWLRGLGRVVIPLQKDSYGLALNPIIEGLLVGCMHLLDAGIGTVSQIDAVVGKLFKMKIPPFMLCDMIGGTKIVNEAVGGLHDGVSPWYRHPRCLVAKATSGESWVTGNDGGAEVDAKTAETIGNSVLGLYLGIAGRIFDMALTDPNWIDTGVEAAFRLPSPTSVLMKVGGAEKARALIEAYRETEGNAGLEVPEWLKVSGTKSQKLTSAWVREDQDGVAVLVPQAPLLGNPIGSATIEGLSVHCEQIERDPNIVAAVITGCGPAFAAGANLKEMTGALGNADRVRGMITAGKSVFAGIEAMTKPVVAAINGAAMGGGLELASHCHYRIASETAGPIGVPEMNLGIYPGWGGVARLPLQVRDPERAFKIIMGGGAIDAKTAFDIDFIQGLARPGELLSRAVQIARELADGTRDRMPVPEGPYKAPAVFSTPAKNVSPSTYAILCRVIREMDGKSLSERNVLETEGFVEAAITADAQEGVTAFLEKRKADFPSAREEEGVLGLS